MTRRRDEARNRRRSGGPYDAPPPEATVGEVIRQARERHGESQAHIAEKLRIKATYLAAIEAGDADALPGPAYSSGFVRAYAQYLDLDGEEMVRRFKQEGAVAAQPQPLSFPAPAPERHIPLSAVAATVLLVVAAGLGAWQYYRATRDVAAQPVPALPAELVAKLENGKAVKAGNDGGPAVQMTGLDASGAAGGVEATPSPAPAGTGSALGARAPRPVPPRGDAAGHRVAAVQPATAGAAGDSAADRSAAAGDAHLPAEIREAAGRMLGAPASAARLALVATGESWIQVQAGDGTVLYSGVLRPGDVYRVPSRDGLKLLTGNAGGLTAYVGGQRVARLGEAGEVRRDIALAAESLRQGGS